MFNIGDKVIRNKDAWKDDKRHKTGIVGVILNENTFRLEEDAEDAVRIIRCWSLLEPAVPVVKESAKPVPFVFIEEGNNFVKVGTGDYKSLEDAHKRCLEFRRLYKTDNIFSYVRVEK